MQTTSARRDKPLLIYDGDCQFCIYWMRYWQRLTGERVNYAPYQDVAAQFPEIPLASFKRAVQYVSVDGKIASGAEAVLLTLSHASGKGFGLTLYRRLPAFAAIADRLYSLVATHRSAFYRPSLSLWGRDYEPPRFDLVSWLFLRAMGLIYLAAFVSFGVQALGLIGSHGILPLSEFAGAIRSQLGSEGYWRFPMVFHLGQSDSSIQAVCWLGATLSLLLIFDVMPRLSSFLLYVLYLSLFYAGQIFMGYQWDLLLLETGFLTLLLTMATKPGIWLLRWLLFRLMFLSGAVKLLSGDPTWANLSALSYYFQTAPLPTPLAWYVHHLPRAVLTASTVATLAIELALPFLIFCPRRLRFVAAFGTMLLQVVILLTGNYAFFNLLTMALCLALFDDAALRRILPVRLTRFVQQHVRTITPRKIVSFAVGAVAMLIVFTSLVQLNAILNSRISTLGRWVTTEIAPLRIVNTYGLFAVMTTTLPEIVVEGSDDGVHWREYGFKYKPGDVMRRPLWNAPHQPRLDWQMWFAALGTARENPWFSQFLQRLLENSPQVTALLGSNPFPDKPPAYVRALLYDYRYSTPEEKKATGAWWMRQPEGIYCPAIAVGS
ncbi:MAG TPA: lipase maturation factor family protein [Candidatus Acidoferrales bacterium]|nr:lipase maturation factor family protein [Candidatus Acidoferrales bacterium]